MTFHAMKPPRRQRVSFFFGGLGRISSGVLPGTMVESLLLFRRCGDIVFIYPRLLSAPPRSQIGSMQEFKQNINVESPDRPRSRRANSYRRKGRPMVRVPERAFQFADGFAGLKTGPKLIWSNFFCAYFRKGRGCVKSYQVVDWTTPFAL